METQDTMIGIDASRSVKPETFKQFLTRNRKVIAAVGSSGLMILGLIGLSLIVITNLQKGQLTEEKKVEVLTNVLKSNSLDSLDDSRKISLPVENKQPINNQIPVNNPIVDRCIKGKIPFAGSIDESAGSSGIATMWLRSKEEVRKLAKTVNFALYYDFGTAKKDNVIVLNCWSTGPWTTGIKFSQISENSAIVKSISTDKENAVRTIQEFGTNFEYVICGYPPFIKEILDYGKRIGVDWHKYTINIVSGGEGFSEGWRNHIRSIIKGQNGEVYSGFGASDIDIGVGFETDFTIKIKGLMDTDPELRKAILGTEQMPCFVGIYNPLFYTLENSPTDELVYTVNNISACSPKLRYNLKDKGVALSFNRIKEIINHSKYKNRFNFRKELKLPLFAVFGRSDGTISLDGANIYPTDIQDAIYKSKWGEYINAYVIDVGYTKDKSMYFKIDLEMVEGFKSSMINHKMLIELQDEIRDHLILANKDYEESWANNHDSLEPKINWHKFGSDIFNHDKYKIKRIVLRSKLNK